MHVTLGVGKLAYVFEKMAPKKLHLVNYPLNSQIAKEMGLLLHDTSSDIEEVILVNNR